MWIIVYYDGRVQKVDNITELIACLDDEIRSITHV